MTLAGIGAALLLGVGVWSGAQAQEAAVEDEAVVEEEVVVEAPIQEGIVEAPIEEAVVEAPIEEAVVEAPIPEGIVEVPIQAFVFQPDVVTVPVGTTVVWTNLDPVAHTVTDVYHAWDSGLFEESGTYSMTFDTPGTYTYYCIPHPMMIGTIEVTG